MRRLRFMLMLTGVMSCAIAARGAERPTLGESVHWERIEERLGGVAIDGTLQWSQPLGSSTETQTLGLRHALGHRIEVDGLGRPTSTWRITGLSTWLAPEGRDRLRWQPPVGAIVRFDRAKIGRAFSSAGPARWLIRETNSGSFDIRGSDGRVWSYQQGVLTRMEHPALGPIMVDSQGGMLREIRRAHDPQARALLQADYDDGGRPHRFAIGEGEPHHFVWKDNRLIAWSRPDGTVVQFVYNNGLLAEIAEADKPIRYLTWAENPRWRQGGSKWPAPVHLTSDGEFDYTCELTSRGIVITTGLRGAKAAFVTTFNPVRGRLEQRDGDDRIIVTFTRGAVGRGALQRIETGLGEVLEEYGYDANGQLVSVKREGEPERILAYDESGRLMDLIERELP